MRKSYLPLTISELYDIDLDAVNRIISEKGLDSDRDITDFFAFNKDKIISLANANQIESIIEEEFLDTQEIIPAIIRQDQVNLLGLESSNEVDMITKESYANFMKEQFSSQKQIFESNQAEQLKDIWPKYAGSIVIQIEQPDNIENLKEGQELCLDIGKFSLIADEVNQQKRKYKITPAINSLYILLFTKKKQYVGKMHHRFFFIWNILHSLGYANFRVFIHSIVSNQPIGLRLDIYLTRNILGLGEQNAGKCFLNTINKETLQKISAEELKAYQSRKYGSESIKILIAFLQVKQTVPALLTPVERSLDLLGALQNRLVAAHPLDLFLKSLPIKMILKKQFLSYYRIGKENEQMQEKEDEGVDKLLKNAELTAVILEEREKQDEKQLEIEIENQKKTGKEVQDKQMQMDGEDNEDNQLQMEEVKDNDNEDEESFTENEEGELLDLEQEDGLDGVNSSEVDSSQTEIGQILGVNDQTVTDCFVSSEAPSFFKSNLFEFQKQALSWMLYKESALTFEQATKQGSSETNTLLPRALSEFWCQLVLLDGTILYYNEYSLQLSSQFQRGETRRNKGGILADEMGLGKTVMALSLIAAHQPPVNHKEQIIFQDQKVRNDPKSAKKLINPKQNKKEFSKLKNEPIQSQPLIRAGTLVVLPLSVLTQWIAEIGRHFDKGAVHYYEYYESRSRNQPILQLYDVVFTTYNILGIEYKQQQAQDQMKQQMQQQQAQSMASQSQQQLWQQTKPSLFSYAWHRVILDEAHTIKGKGNFCSKGAYSLVADYRWCLTGTPIHNCLDDLYSLINFLKVESFEDYYWWNKHINQCEDKQEVFRLLQNILKPILLRRTKRSKYGDGSGIVSLPKKTHKMLLIPFTPYEEKLYKIVQSKSQAVLRKILFDRKEFQANYFHVFAIMTQLRQICDHILLFVKKRNVSGITKNIENLEKELKKELSKKNKLEQASEDQLYTSFLKSFVEEFMQEMSENHNNNSNQRNVQTKAQQSEFQKGIANKLKNIQDVEECFCMESFRQEVSLLKCGHCFHPQCVVELLKRNGSALCPLCRSQFREADIKLIKIDAIKKEARKQEAEAKTYFQKTIEEKKEYLKVLRLFSTESSSKLNQVLIETKKVQAKREKVIIYSQFLGFLSLIQSVLSNAGIRFTRLDGTMNKKERAVAIKSFTEEPSITAIVISLKAGAFGLNLIAANNVFICDPWYNPAIEEQAVERCHRIGQTKPVEVKNFIIENSIEQRILDCQRGKRALIHNTLNIKDNQLQRALNQEANMSSLRYMVGFTEDIEETDKEEHKREGEREIERVEIDHKLDGGM